MCMAPWEKGADGVVQKAGERTHRETSKTPQANFLDPLIWLRAGPNSFLYNELQPGERKTNLNLRELLGCVWSSGHFLLETVREPRGRTAFTRLPLRTQVVRRITF